MLLQARQPLIHAGQGVLYAEATPELIELADLLQIPVMTTLEGKSAFPEDHPLALGSGSGVMSGPVYHFLGRADVVFAIGTGLTKHGMATTIPARSSSTPPPMCGTSTRTTRPSIPSSGMHAWSCAR